MSISENLARVRERIDAAARRAGRNSKDIRLMAVSKTFGADAVREAFAAGQRLFGENRVQEYAEKAGALHDLDVEFHMIGHLQSNKAARAAELFAGVDSLDSVALGDRLNAAAVKAEKVLPVLVEVNVGGEESKSGVRPDSVEIEQIFGAAANWPNLRIQGLMAIPPLTRDPEAARPFFRVLRQFCEDFTSKSYPGVRMEVLSMGMSHDFEVAIEEGSTCVRIGTAIFGERTNVLTLSDQRSQFEKS
jgi:pyridoxal phosphate enzyme (YggS family)